MDVCWGHRDNDMHKVLGRIFSLSHGRRIRRLWGGLWKFVPQLSQQFHARIALDRLVVEVMSDAAFKLPQLSQGQGVLTSEDEFVNSCIHSQVLQQLPIIWAPCR